MKTVEVLHKFLSSIGEPAEAGQYLRWFRSAEPERFALLLVHDAVVTNAIQALGVDLHFLTRLNLTPVLCCTKRSVREQLVDDLAATVDLVPCEQVEEARVCAREQRIPVLLTPDQDVLNTAARDLLSRKVVYLVPRSGIQLYGAAVRSLIDLTTDYEELMAPRTMPPEQQRMLADIHHLFDSVAHSLTVAVTSPFDLLRELFTVKGAGTLIRRGARVEHHASYQTLEHAKLDQLITMAFQAKVAEEFYERPTQAILLADDYRGVAIVEDKPLAPYLSKFAVDIRARGEGIGGDLWRALGGRCERLFWRARPDNPITSWYAGHCDGLVRTKSWTVYWIGLAHHEIGQAIELARLAPVDFAR